MNTTNVAETTRIEMLRIGDSNSLWLVFVWIAASFGERG